MKTNGSEDTRRALCDVRALTNTHAMSDDTREVLEMLRELARTRG